MRVIQVCFKNVSSGQFWSLADNCQELVKSLHAQVRLMENFGLMERCHGSLIQKVQSVLSVKKMLRMSIIFCLIDPNSKLTLNLSGKN